MLSNGNSSSKEERDKVSYIFEGMHKINQSHSRDDGHKNKVISRLILKLCIDKNQTKL